MASGPSVISSVLFRMLWFRESRLKWNTRLKLPDFCFYLALLLVLRWSPGPPAHPENTPDLLPSPTPPLLICSRWTEHHGVLGSALYVFVLRSNLSSLVACKKYFEELENFFSAVCIVFNIVDLATKLTLSQFLGTKGRLLTDLNKHKMGTVRNERKLNNQGIISTNSLIQNVPICMYVVYVGGSFFMKGLLEEKL